DALTAAPGSTQPTGTPLDLLINPISDALANTPLEAPFQQLVGALAGGLPMPGGTDGGPLPTTGTPLDMVFTPINDAINGGLPMPGGTDGGPLPTTGTPLDMAINPINDALHSAMMGTGGSTGGGLITTGGEQLASALSAIPMSEPVTSQISSGAQQLGTLAHMLPIPNNPL
ncbi:MAG TPA: hypothetical protein VFX23_13740, partial [Limnobacter sp.]|nr:hypothetical protein [Limnobacter sp.]